MNMKRNGKKVLALAVSFASVVSAASAVGPRQAVQAKYDELRRVVRESTNRAVELCVQRGLSSQEVAEVRQTSALQVLRVLNELDRQQQEEARRQQTVWGRTCRFFASFFGR
ncbi:MAG: hypothetical protein LBJ38_03690 [Oscillospiraceae bacterium]|jgi:phosphoglycerate dehydrogenase-like enzyme|nr:hypothetical protein [Oscillospiraceae bacterium]